MQTLLLDGAKPGTNNSLIPGDILQMVSTGITVALGIGYADDISSHLSYVFDIIFISAQCLKFLQWCTVVDSIASPIEVTVSFDSLLHVVKQIGH